MWGWASTAQIDLWKVRLERLGFFRSVAVETPAVPGTEDQIDVEFTVEEQPSDHLGNAGFAQATGLILGAQYQENNVRFRQLDRALRELVAVPAGRFVQLL